jgi:hypothetical protein
MLGKAISRNGVGWERVPDPLLVPNPDTQAYISSGYILDTEETRYLFFVDETEEATSSTIQVMSSPDQGNSWEESYQVLLPAEYEQWDNTRVHDPFILPWNGSLYLYYAGGPRRRSNGIGVAILEH